MNNSFKITSFFLIATALLITSCTKNEITDLTADKTQLNLIVGQSDSVQINVSFTGDINKQPVTLTSANPNIATVKEGTATTGTRSLTTSSKTVVVQGISAGTTTITVQAGTKTVTVTITVDNIYPALSQGELDYWGDVYNSGMSNNFTIYLASQGINLTNLSGTGEVLVIEVNTDSTAKDSIPTRNYVMMPALNSNYLTPGSLVPAYTDSAGYKWGCWYFGNTTNGITQGTATFSRDNTNYIIKYDFFDTNGAEISGTYMGALSYVDLTKKTVKAAIKRNYMHSSVRLTPQKSLKRMY
jgi:hypothetical protein